MSVEIEDAVVVREASGESGAESSGMETVDASELFFAKPAAGETCGTDVLIPEPAVPAPPEPAPAAGSMKVGQTLFGVTATGEPLGKSHWLADSSACGDLVMALPASCLIAGRTAEAGGVAVDMAMFLDGIITGAAKLEGLSGIAEVTTLPLWAVGRLFGTFPALYAVYSEAMDQCVLAVEAAAFKAAVGMKIRKSRKFRKERQLLDSFGKPMKDENGNAVTVTESTEENFDADLPPDPTLSKTILTSRMRGRYKDEARSNQAVIINISGPEANL